MFIILDRDGVINKESSSYIKSPDEWIPIPGSLEKIANWSQSGHRVAIATNQSGIARGLLDTDTLNAIHIKFEEALGKLGGKVEGIFYCPHHPKAQCACRKPKPGLLNQIAQTFNIKLEETVFIGDSLCDIQAARNAGCQPVLLKTGNGKKTLAVLDCMQDITVFDNLSAVIL